MTPGITHAAKKNSASVRARCFKTGPEFRDWLARHGSDERELLLGFYKHGSGRPGITYPQALDEALCFGWIDGVRRRVDKSSYTFRFTPRRPRSIWSRINISRVLRLKKEGRLRPPGSKAFAAREAERGGVYSFENRSRPLAPLFKAKFKSNREAWAFFQSRPPWYRKVASWWVMSAKKPETRRRRLATLMADSADRRTIRPLTRPAG